MRLAHLARSFGPISVGRAVPSLPPRAEDGALGRDRFSFSRNGLSGRQATSLDVLVVVAVLLCLGMPARGQGERRNGLSIWEHSIVSVEVARKQYDYAQPWSTRTRRALKCGVVVGERQVLTTADEMFDRTLVRLQKGGHGRWWLGEISWIDYHANLALVTTSEAEFWRDLKPASFGAGVPEDGTLQIVRWRDGNLESRKAEFTRYAVREGQLSPVNQPVLEASSEIQNGGWGEPVVANGRLAGILCLQDGRTCTAVPASFIQAILDARDKQVYQGLGYFHFYWQPAANPASLAMLKQPGEPRGVIVVDVPERPDAYEQVLKTNDIILQIEGHDLDVEGDYVDPEFGSINLECLATRGKSAGEALKMRVWRNGQELDVLYRLPRFAYTNSLVPYAVYDQEPDYLIVGGLVFQPLTDLFLQSWGNEWKRRAPFRLTYYGNESPTKERPALVFLSEVLPDPYNLGYQEQRYLVVDKVNGRRVNRLTELRDALQQPTNALHVIEFVQSDSLRRMVVGAGDAESEATRRVLKRYGIAQAFRCATEAGK